MFVKFTRLDGSPIWLNAAFVVTVEPRRDGGSIVVPIGDGLDYDVRESPEQALALLGETSVASAPDPVEVAKAVEKPAVVPVPPPAALPEKFADVVASGLSAPQPDEVDTKPVEEPAPAKAPAKTTRTRKTKKAAEADASTDAEAKPKKATRTRKTKKAEALPPPLDEAQLERLRKLAPGSLRKLKNTLSSQFPSTDVDATVQFLVESNVLSLDAQDHVTWIS